MKQYYTTLIVIGAVLSLFVPSVCATPTEWHNMPVAGNDAGDVFELRFEIKSDETTNYSITLDPPTKFSVIDGENTISIEITKDETRTFVFNMQLEEDLADGKHAIDYTASKEDTSFKNDIAYVRVGKQAPGFEIIVFISALAIAFIILKKRK